MTNEYATPCARILEALDNGWTRDEVAAVYVECIAEGVTAPWKTINQAIIRRWGTTGLYDIKRRAWKTAKAINA
jgi:hypothetical protein